MHVFLRLDVSLYKNPHGVWALPLISQKSPTQPVEAAPLPQRGWKKAVGWVICREPLLSDCSVPFVAVDSCCLDVSHFAFTDR